MRTLHRWAHALVALSVLTLSAVAFAETPSGSPPSQDTASHGRSSLRKHDRRPSATARKHHAQRTAQHTTTSPRSSRNHDSEASSDKHRKPSTTGGDGAKPGKNTSKSAKSTRHSQHSRSARRAHSIESRTAPKPSAQLPCFHDAVTVVRGADNHSESFSLTRCNGRPVDGALDRLTGLLAPQLAAKPEPASTHHQVHGRTAQHGTAPSRHLDQGLLTRMQAIAAHFPGKSLRVASSYRPMSTRSYHQTGRAVDLVVAGVSNEDLVAFCRTLPDTGCGYYPNSSFVHVDVRKHGTGHVYWIDASKPGESARYVTSWPEKADGTSSEAAAPPDADAHSDDDSQSRESSPHSNKPPAQPRSDLELDSRNDSR